MNRRALLGAAAVLATGALPVWTRLFADEGRMRRPDSRPFPHLPAGQESMPEIKHVVVRAKVFAHVAPSPCPTSGLRQDWNASHLAYNNGRNVGFVRATGPVAMEVLDGLRMPFTYSFGDHRHRRRHVQSPRPNGMIFDRFDAHDIEWANYFQNVPSMRIVPDLLTKPGRAARLHHFGEFAAR